MEPKSFDALKEYTQPAYDAITGTPEGAAAEIYETLIKGGCAEQEARMRTMAYVLREAQSGRNLWDFALWGKSTWG